MEEEEEEEEESSDSDPCFEESLETRLPDFNKICKSTGNYKFFLMPIHMHIVVDKTNVMVKKYTMQRMLGYTIDDKTCILLKNGKWLYCDIVFIYRMLTFFGRPNGPSEVPAFREGPPDQYLVFRSRNKPPLPIHAHCIRPSVKANEPR